MTENLCGFFTVNPKFFTLATLSLYNQTLWVEVVNSFDLVQLVGERPLRTFYIILLSFCWLCPNAKEMNYVHSALSKKLFKPRWVLFKMPKLHQRWTPIFLVAGSYMKQKALASLPQSGLKVREVKGARNTNRKGHFSKCPNFTKHEPQL